MLNNRGPRTEPSIPCLSSPFGYVLRERIQIICMEYYLHQFHNAASAVICLDLQYQMLH